MRSFIDEQIFFNVKMENEDLRRLHHPQVLNELHVCGPCESTLTFLGYGFSHLSCKNKPICLQPLRLEEEASEGLGPHRSCPGERAGRTVSSSQKSLSSFVGSSYSQRSPV